jgi:outer membrane protein assembly factor BamA
MEGLLRPLVGLQFGHVSVGDYTGEGIDGAVEQETKLAEDTRLGKILGFKEGWDNSIRTGVAYDTRNYEPDPTSGILAQVFVLGSLRAMGSAFNYGQSTFGLTYYTPVIPAYDLIAVGITVYSMRFGDVPFYAMNRLALPKDEIKTGLGGFPTLRGYSTSRFVGMTTIGADAELRWSFAEFTLFNQHLKSALATFVDSGRVFDTTGGFSAQDWKASVGSACGWRGTSRPRSVLTLESAPRATCSLWLWDTRFEAPPAVRQGRRGGPVRGARVLVGIFSSGFGHGIS